MMKLSVTIDELFEKDVESVPQEKRFDLNVVSEALWHCTEILRAVNNPERRSELLTHFLASQPSIPPGRYMEKVEEDNRTLRSTIPPCAQDDPPNNLPFNGEETYVIEPRSTISKGEQPTQIIRTGTSAAPSPHHGTDRGSINDSFEARMHLTKREIAEARQRLRSGRIQSDR